MNDELTQPKDRKIHLLDQRVPTPAVEYTVCGAPIATEGLLYTLDPKKVTCLRCEPKPRLRLAE